MISLLCPNAYGFEPLKTGLIIPRLSVDISTPATSSNASFSVVAPTSLSSLFSKTLIIYGRYVIFFLVCVAAFPISAKSVFISARTIPCSARAKEARLEIKIFFTIIWLALYLLFIRYFANNIYLKLKIELSFISIFFFIKKSIQKHKNFSNDQYNQINSKTP